MRTHVSLFFLVAFAACQQAPKADKAEVTDVQAVKQPDEHGKGHRLDSAASILYWIGTKPTGEHKGTFRFSSGELHVKDSMLTSGQFEINITSLRNLDLSAQPDMQKKLEAELLGPNFFDAAQFPTARFEITDVEEFHPGAADKGVLLKDATHMIKGNLTIKNVSKNISFPAKIALKNGKVLAAADFNIDRTQWGMTYRADKSVQDKLINSIVNIRFEIVTK